MKKALVAIFLLLAAGRAWGQAATNPQPTGTVVFPGAPTGTCTVIPPMEALDEATGQIYGCQFVSGLGTWVSQSSTALWSTLALSGTNTGTGMVLAPTSTGTTALTINIPAGFLVPGFVVTAPPVGGTGAVNIAGTQFGEGGSGVGEIGNVGIITSRQFFSSGASGSQGSAYNLGSAESLSWENNAGTGQVLLGKNTSDNLTWPNAINAAGYQTATNCSSSASPAVCGSASAGSFTVAAAATSEVVDTTAVTANSQIILTFDSSLGTKLGVTCNTTFDQAYVTARTAGTSFTITASAPSTNPACYSYQIVN